MILFVCNTSELHNVTKQKNCPSHRQFFAMKTIFFNNSKQSSIKKCNYTDIVTLGPALIISELLVFTYCSKFLIKAVARLLAFSS